MLWALQQNDPDNWLAPESDSLADMLALIAQCDGDFKLNLDHYKYPERYADALDSSVYRSSASKFLLLLEQRLEQNVYLYGSRCALADMAIAPFVRQFAHTDKAWFASQPWPKLQAWLSTILESEIYEVAMTRYTPWQEGQAVTCLPPQIENAESTVT